MNMRHSIRSSGEVNKLSLLSLGFREGLPTSTLLLPWGVDEIDTPELISAKSGWTTGALSPMLLRGLKVKSSSFSLKVSSFRSLRMFLSGASLLGSGFDAFLEFRALLDLLCFRGVMLSLQSMLSIDFLSLEDLLLLEFLSSFLPFQRFLWLKSRWYWGYGSEDLEGQLLSFSLYSSSSMGSGIFDKNEGCRGRDRPSLGLSCCRLLGAKIEYSSGALFFFLKSLTRIFSLNLTSCSSFCLSLTLEMYFLRLIWSCLRLTKLICFTAPLVAALRILITSTSLSFTLFLSQMRSSLRISEWMWAYVSSCRGVTADAPRL